jgi:hypothetical protein
MLTPVRHVLALTLENTFPNPPARGASLRLKLTRHRGIVANARARLGGKAAVGCWVALVAQSVPNVLTCLVLQASFGASLRAVSSPALSALR